MGLCAPAYRRPGIFEVLRGLSPSRTRSRFGRLVATTLAMLVSLLLVGTVGPVYGAGGTTSNRTTLTAATPQAVDCSGLSLVGGVFEVDGDVPVDCGGSKDWADTGVHVVDGAKDHSAYTQGDAENTPSSQWHDGGSSQGKDDVTDAYGWTSVLDGDVWTFFGIGRVGDNGTTTYDMELNRNAGSSTSPVRPQRSAGDLLLQFSVNGTGPLSFDEAYQWTAQADFTGAGCFASGSTGYGWCPLATVRKPDFISANSSDGLFAEGALDLSALGRANHDLCTGSYGVVNIRTVASEQHTAALQDYVAPLDVSTPSTCSAIVIRKYDATGGNLLGGASFSVSPDPTPGSSSSGPLGIEDNTGQQGYAGPDDDPTPGVLEIGKVQPGTYTVAETRAPGGYLFPAATSQTLPVGRSSTVTFRFDDPKHWQGLQVGNTAQASYTRSYRWRLEKGVGDSVAGPFSASDTRRIPDSASDSASFGYRIRVMEDGYTDTARTVSGTLTVTNPNDAAVTVHLADELSDTTPCTFADTTVAVPGDDQPHHYAYSCAPSTTAATSSNGTVTWARADFPQAQSDVGAAGSYSAQAAASFGWTEHPVHEHVTVTDDQYDLGTGGWRISYGNGTGTVHTTTYTEDLTGAAGTCTDSRSTATLTADDDPGYSTSASTTATLCVGRDLVVAKSASPTLTRTYGWQVTKTADQAHITTPTDGSATASFTLHVLAGPASDSQWAMTGAITVTNPNDWEDVGLTGLTDWFDGGTTGHEGCVITDWSSLSHVVAAGASRTYHYSCTFDQKPAYDGTNTATATWDGTAATTPGSTADGMVAVSAAQWAETSSVDRTVDLYDDGGSNGATWTRVNDAPLQWQPGLDRSFSYPMTVTVAPGTCKAFTNQARVMNGAVLVAGPAAASVTACNPQGLTVRKTSDATFVRTYHWSVQKSVADPATVRGASYSHTFDYEVTATPGGYTDGQWRLSGSIHVANPNTDPDLAPVTATVTDEAVGVGGGAACTVDDGHDTVTLASGDSVDLPYRCAFTGTPTDGTDVATVSWQGGQVSAQAPVVFTQAGSVDQTVELWDDEVTGPGRLLGTATWGGQPTSFHYAKTLTAPSATCTTFVNHAWLTSLGAQSHLGDASATATICPVPGTWKVVKTSTPVSGSTVLPGEEISYHVTVSKTGGVDPTGVVVHDDLSSVVDHASDPVITAPAGTTATYDATTHVLTWDVGTVSGTLALDYRVTVDAGAFGATLRNQVTSDGSDDCSPGAGSAADCSTVHYTPRWSLTKTSDPAPGAQVSPGDLVTYTLRVENTGPATLSGAVVEDDLSDVLDDATWGEDTSGDGTASLSGSTLTWQVADLAPGRSATLRYTVTVKAAADGVTLRNVATPATPGGECAVRGGCTTTQHTPAWTLTKTSDRAPGAQVLPGDRIRYALTVRNTGQGTLTGATVADDLSDVLDDATWDDDATGDGTASLSGSTLTWHLADLAAGAEATLTYSVTVRAGADGATLRNVATPGTPGGACANDGGCSTTQYTPAWTLTKSSDPGSGSTVRPGDAVTYTLTVHNTGAATLTGAAVTDDLSGVLSDARLESPLAAGLSFDGDRTLRWSVPDVAPGGSASVSYAVTVGGEYGATLRNLATPGTPGGSCATAAGCSTAQYTPHYTLSKSSSVLPGGTVLPPYLGADGDTIGYTLTAVNDSRGTVEGAVVTDDLADVLDDAAFVAGSLDPGDRASLSGHTLTWRLPPLQPGERAVLRYRVTVATDRWDRTLTNVAVPDEQGSCALGNDGQPLCSTTAVTPPYTRLAVKKVDAETGDPLPGATFSLAAQEDPGTVVGTATSGADGVAVFATRLQPGHYLVTETAAPDGYELPSGAAATMPVTIGEPGAEPSNFVAGGVMAPVEFRDAALGQLAIEAKEQYRLAADGSWVRMADTDSVHFGDEVKYVIEVAATGPRRFHDVTVTDYLPGYNPADTTSTGRATLVPGSAGCTGGLTCTVSTDPATGKVTWSAGTVTRSAGAAEMVVQFPQLPSDPVFDDRGRYTTTLWNAGYLDWDEAPGSVAGQGDATMVHHRLTSNDVVVSATYVQASPPVRPPHGPSSPPRHAHQGTPPPGRPAQGAPPVKASGVLPNTGGPQWWYLPTGAGLVLLGAGVLLGRGGRRRREV